MKYLKITLAFTVFTISACSITPPIPPSETAIIKKNGIHIYEDRDSKPHFSIVGTTVFNNDTKIIPNVPTFAEHLANRLKTKGVPVTISAKSVKSPQLRIIPVMPYNEAQFSGLGASKRNFLGIHSPLILHVNFFSEFEMKPKGALVRSLGLTAPLFPIAGYQQKESTILRNVGSWNELTAQEKETVEKELSNLMNQASEPILHHLGF
jgi:hypothetical protein